MRMKIGALVAIAVLGLSMLGCSFSTFLATPTPVPTATATATSTPLPTSTPTAVPTETLVPSPTADPCTDTQNQIYGFLDNEATKGFLPLDEDIRAHFPGQSQIIVKGLDADLAKLKQMLKDVEALDAPPFLSKYHELEIAFLSDYVKGVEYAVKGDRVNAFTYLIKSDGDYKLVALELERIRVICPPPTPVSQSG